MNQFLVKRRRTIIASNDKCDLTRFQFYASSDGRSNSNGDAIGWSMNPAGVFPSLGLELMKGRFSTSKGPIDHEPRRTQIAAAPSTRYC